MKTLKRPRVASRRKHPGLQALGGRLDLVASFADHTLTVTSTEAA